jgi:hypothetical protein
LDSCLNDITHRTKFYRLYDILLEGFFDVPWNFIRKLHWTLKIDGSY